MQRRLCGLLAFAMLGGCIAPAAKRPLAQPGNIPPKDTAKAVISNTDPSAMKLQDIEGAVLLYYATHKRLPTGFDQLQTFAEGDAPVDASCPGSKAPYVFTADGFKLQDRESRIIVYEPAPLHAGFRLAITIAEPKPDEPLVAKVIALPESFFLLHPPETVAPPAAPTTAR